MAAPPVAGADHDSALCVFPHVGVTVPTWEGVVAGVQLAAEEYVPVPAELTAATLK